LAFLAFYGRIATHVTVVLVVLLPVVQPVVLAIAYVPLNSGLVFFATSSTTPSA
jgi:hypothetical protein